MPASDPVAGPFSRRVFLKLSGALPLSLALPGCAVVRRDPPPALASGSHYLHTRDKVPDPTNLFFSVQYPGKPPIRLAAHYWYNADAVKRGTRCPAIVEFLPYRRRDGTMLADSKMYPWFAYNEYLCFRVDLQGSGDSEGVLTDEYTDEELSYCTQVIQQIAAHPACDGKVGMMGKSWSAINSLMVAARRDRPAALKAVVVCCGSDDRWSDDVHYMGGAMMFDNVSWPSSMFGWLAVAPDPAVVGDVWQDIWRERIQNVDFWLQQWGAHQARDAYWSAASVRGRWNEVQVPVFVLAGWQDGYKNPVERLVSGLAAAGKPVSGLLGPWGHKYPFGGYPGPRIDWLRYIVTHWWDRWLKGKKPDPKTEWPQLPVWLGASKEPDKSACADEAGKWVAEDGQWLGRVREQVFYLGPRNHLGRTPAATTYLSPAPIVLATTMLETSSWGECENDDLPGDQASADRASLFFDSDPLPEDLDVFGYPTVDLHLSADAPVVSLAVRLCEVSPTTQASHLVSYRFFNLAYRRGDMARPERIVPGSPFRVRIPLNLIGHTFQKGWRVRLAFSPSFFPTMWQGPSRPRVTVHTRESTLTLPGRAPRADDARLQRLLPATSAAEYVNPEDYVPILAEARAARTSRISKPIRIGGRPGVLVKKVFDSGRYQYGGPLQGLWVDQVAQENFQLLVDDPLSMTGVTRSAATLERPATGWRIRTETSTWVWSERENGAPVFRYSASVRTFVGTKGSEKPFEEKTVEGTIKRSWI